MSIRPIIQLQESKLNYADLVADIEKIMVKFDLNNAETININKVTSSESKNCNENQHHRRSNQNSPYTVLNSNQNYNRNYFEKSNYQQQRPQR